MTTVVRIREAICMEGIYTGIFAQWLNASAKGYSEDGGCNEATGFRSSQRRNLRRRILLQLLIIQENRDGVIGYMGSLNPGQVGGRLPASYTNYDCKRIRCASNLF